ncbi:MAG: ABC transporter substrate-binding protein, partial [Agathobacter sp.]|nr:ABC transporter substrate-binding protein [Agathobacter sp.]
MGRKGMKNTIPKIVAFGLVACIGLTSLGVAPVKADQKTSSGNSTYTAEYSSERLSSNYTQISTKYTLPQYKGENIVINIEESISDIGTAKLTDEIREYDGANKVLDMELDDTVSITVNVPEDGQYFVLFDYLSYDESILPIEMAMQVDGEYPFYECRNLEFETYWTPDEEPSYDRYGNQLVTVPNKMIRWEEKYLMDSSYRHSAPLAVELKAGAHTFSFTVNEGNFLLGNLTLVAPFETEEYKGSETATGKELITIQGEDIFEANSSSIHGIAEFDTSVYPYETVDTKLNTLDSGSFDTAGQTVTYQFEVTKAGYYYIGMNYKQSDKTDFQVFFDVRIDGKIPNTAFETYGMNYNTKYKTTTLTDNEGKNLRVYREEGGHTISFTISMDAIREVMEQLDVIMSGVNDLALEITKVAGTNSDKYRDLKLSKYIPDLEDKLYGYSD